MTTVSQEAREAYLSMNMLPEFDAADVRAGRWDNTTGLQAFAKFEQSIRQSAERGEAWRPIETAPKDGTPFLAAIYVCHNDEPRRWDMHVIGYDAAYGEMNSYFETGWEIEDYAFWQPLPTPPEAA